MCRRFDPRTRKVGREKTVVGEDVPSSKCDAKTEKNILSHSQCPDVVEKKLAVSKIIIKSISRDFTTKLVYI